MGWLVSCNSCGSSQAKGLIYLLRLFAFVKISLLSHTLTFLFLDIEPERMASPMLLAHRSLSSPPGGLCSWSRHLSAAANYFFSPLRGLLHLGRWVPIVFPFSVISTLVHSTLDRHKTPEADIIYCYYGCLGDWCGSCFLSKYLHFHQSPPLQEILVASSQELSESSAQGCVCSLCIWSVLHSCCWILTCFCILG